MEAIASYSAHSIEWKSDFTLFPDALVLRYSRGIFGQRGEERFPLTTLDPKYISQKFRRDVFITAGGMMALFSLLVCLRLFRAHALSWPLLFVVVTFGFGVALIGVGFRMVEFAQFQTQGGGPGFRIPCYGRRREKFNAFIDALTRQIQKTKQAA